MLIGGAFLPLSRRRMRKAEPCPVRFKLAAYVKAAARTTPSLMSKHVTPHSFHHATAVHLVSAGVDRYSGRPGALPRHPRAGAKAPATPALCSTRRRVGRHVGPPASLIVRGLARVLESRQNRDPDVVRHHYRASVDIC